MSAGDCYEKALRFLQGNPSWSLVHGIVTGQGAIDGVRYGHAWCERDGVVWDPTHDREFPAAFYYLLGKIEYTKRYDFTAANQQALKTEIYGPWDETIAKASHRDD